MHQNWKKHKLGDFAKLRKETIKLSEFNGEHYIGLEHIGQGTFLLDGLGVASDANSNKSKFKNGDILYGKIRPYFKKVYRPKFDGICSTDILVIKTKDEKIITQDFLHQIIKTQDFTDKATETSSGTKMPRADWNSIKTLEYSLPTLKEQKAIAQILSAIDDKIENNLAINKTLEEMAMALYKHWFLDFGPFQDGNFVDSELGEIPEGWEVKELKDIVKVINGYAFKGKDFIDSGVPVLKIKNVKAGKILYDNLSYVSQKTALNASKAKINFEDILITMTGNRFAGSTSTWVGKVALFLRDGDYYLNQRVSKLQIKKNDFLSKYYLTLMLSSYEFQYYFITNSTSSGGQANISPDLIYNTSIVIPPKNEMEKFDDIVRNHFSLIYNNEIENQILTQLRDTLLPKLISGEVRLKEFQEQTAAIL